MPERVTRTRAQGLRPEARADVRRRPCSAGFRTILTGPWPAGCGDSPCRSPHPGRLRRRVNNIADDMAVQASNCRNARETHGFPLLAEDIPGSPNKGNIGNTRKIIGRQAMAQHDPGEGTQEAEAGGGQFELSGHDKNYLSGELDAIVSTRSKFDLAMSQLLVARNPSKRRFGRNNDEQVEAVPKTSLMEIKSKSQETTISESARLLLRRVFRILKGCGLSESELRHMATVGSQ